MELNFNKKLKINPNDIELLIFDLDGTIFPTAQPEFEAIKSALSRLGWNEIKITEGKVKEVMGKTSEEVYREILSQDKISRWQELAEEVRIQRNYIFPKYIKTFPRTRETLELLKKRGYKLALYTNSPIHYLKLVVSLLNIAEYFDYIECIEENNLTKIELVKKIKNRFSIPESVVIGDRIHDIEAAKGNNALSVGVLYGYGKEDELKKADIKINKFSELTEIFDRKLPVFEKIVTEIKKRKRKNKAFVVGVNGIDTSGKTKFTEALGKFLLSKRYKIQVINLDDFHNPKKIRYSGENQAENYYNKSFDIQTIVNKLLIPIQQKSKFNIKLDTLNLTTDKYETKKSYAFNEDTIVIFEGVFLFRKELSPFIDYKIFIEIPFEESKNRAKVRDVPLNGEEVLKKYDEKYLPAQKRYLQEFPTSKIADIIIDNTNWEYPKIKTRG